MPAVRLVLRVNGSEHEVQAAPDTPLLFILRNDLGLRAAKLGCALEQCGACVVLVDGEAVASCHAPVASFVGRAITTLEGIGTPASPDPLQEAFVAEGAAQCGYCIPGILVAARALLDRVPRPSDAEIRSALDGHLCRCGTHPRILRAVRRAATAHAT
ncbi:MAG: nicotinate dehydrogenase subunit [Solirubrobacteraceae bacterium]